MLFVRLTVENEPKRTTPQQDSTWRLNPLAECPLITVYRHCNPYRLGESMR